MQQPGTNQISIKYNTVATQEAQGSLNDEKIQQLLLYAARNNYNTGVRVDSVDLLAQRSGDMQVREALMYALQNDTNPGVRLKSLDALGNYVKNDTNVRDAVLRALVNDGNSGVRIEALRLIEPVKADGSVRGVLMALAAKDQSHTSSRRLGPCWRSCRRLIREVALASCRRVRERDAPATAAGTAALLEEMRRIS